MRFRGTTILLAVFVLLGGYVYFTEFRGREAREQQEAAEKKAVRFESKDITEVSLTYDSNTITGVKKGEGQWEITSPQGIEADSAAWDSLAQSIADIQREEAVLAASPADLAQFGLDKPVLEIGIKLGDGPTTQIQFGSENPRKTLNYLKVSDSSDVLLSSSKADVFRKSLTDLRDKKVLDVAPDNVDSVRFQNTVLQKSGEEWTLREPIQARADASEVSTLLSTIQFARASGFAEPSMDLREAGLSPPAIQVAIHDATANADRVLLIGKEMEAGKYYAKDASRPAIFIVDNQITDKLRRPIFEWRDKSIVRINRDQIQEIEIALGAERFSFKKVGEDWNLADGRKLQWEKVSSMLNTLEFEKSKAIVDTPGTLSTYGLDRPKLEVRFRQAGTPELNLAFGANSQTPEGIYLKNSSSPAVLVVSTDVYDKFNVKVDDLVETKPATSGTPGTQ